MPNKPNLISHRGKSLTVDQWSVLTEIPAGTIRHRIYFAGWPIERALDTPVQIKFRPSPAMRGPQRGAGRPVPKLRKAETGSAFIRWQTAGKRHERTFGVWGSDEANEAYRRFAVDWVSGLADVKASGETLLVIELAAAYKTWASGYYVKNGKPTSMIHLIKTALMQLDQLCGTMPVDEFSVDDLRAFQASLVSEGYVRETVNKYAWVVCSMFAWGASQLGANRKPLAPPSVADMLVRVRKLKAGRTSAPESVPLESVPWKDVEATFPHLHRDKKRRAVIESLIRVHWLTGMRPSEILSMRPCDISRDGDTWHYRPTTHKNQHRSLSLEYWLGPRAISLIAPLLANRMGLSDDDPVFALPRADRKNSKIWRLQPTNYRRIVHDACIAAGVPAWYPHRLRKSRATEVARYYQSDTHGASAIGDSPDTARKHYIDPDRETKRKIARETG
jgi:integrase